MIDPCELNQQGKLEERITHGINKCIRDYPAPSGYRGKNMLKMTKKELLGVILDIKINAYKIKPLEWNDNSDVYETEASTFCYDYSIEKFHNRDLMCQCIPSDDMDCRSVLFEECKTIEEGKQKCWEHWLENITLDLITVMK